MSGAYYNEIDPYAAQWLRNLIAAGHIAPGDVDERNIEDVRPSDLRGYAQCHFFAGVGVWSRALRDAGVPDDANVWSGSCPCQPFSAAGKGNGFADERHLWPAFHYLIEECRPAIVFGEQVASAHVNAWIDLVQTDLEALDFAFGAVAFPAAGVGAPHIRDRTYWLAYAGGDGLAIDGRSRAHLGTTRSNSPSAKQWQRLRDELGADSDVLCGLADADDARSQGWPGVSERTDQCAARPDNLASGLADSAVVRYDGRRPGKASDGRDEARLELERLRAVGGFWSDAEWIACRDNKWRPVEPGTFPLAHGAPARVGRLRAYGNAIVLPQATEFVRASLEAIDVTFR